MRRCHQPEVRRGLEPSGLVCTQLCQGRDPEDSAYTLVMEHSVTGKQVCSMSWLTKNTEFLDGWLY